MIFYLTGLYQELLDWCDENQVSCIITPIGYLSDLNTGELDYVKMSMIELTDEDHIVMLNLRFNTISSEYNKKFFDLFAGISTELSF
jgi:hypothetical protein